MTKSNAELNQQWKQKLKDEKMYLKLLKRELLLHQKSTQCIINHCILCNRSKENIVIQQKNVNNITEFLKQYG